MIIAHVILINMCNIVCLVSWDLVVFVESPFVYYLKIILQFIIFPSLSNGVPGWIRLTSVGWPSWAQRRSTPQTSHGNKTSITWGIFVIIHMSDLILSNFSALARTTMIFSKSRALRHLYKTFINSQNVPFWNVGNAFFKLLAGIWGNDFLSCSLWQYFIMWEYSCFSDQQKLLWWDN